MLKKLAIAVEKSSNAIEYDAVKPKDLNLKDWWLILKRIIKNIKVNYIMIVAPGIAFFLFLSVFPALFALVSLYGLVFNPDEVQNQLSQLTIILPKNAGELITGTLSRISKQSKPQLEWDVIISFLISLWTANFGMKALFRGINIVYKEKHSRNIVEFNAISLLFTISGIIIGIISLALIVGFPVLSKHFDVPPMLYSIITFGRWLFLGIIIILFIASIYKFAPDRRSAKFRWVTWGSVVATLLWLGASWGFSFYVENFGNFDQKYGTVASGVILMLWFLISSFLILLGAEINSEMEYQTKEDTTIGKSRPMGERKAYQADHYAGQENSDN